MVLSLSLSRVLCACAAWLLSSPLPCSSLPAAPSRASFPNSKGTVTRLAWGHRKGRIEYMHQRTPTKTRRSVRKLERDEEEVDLRVDNMKPDRVVAESSDDTIKSSTDDCNNSVVDGCSVAASIADSSRTPPSEHSNAPRRVLGRVSKRRVDPTSTFARVVESKVRIRKALLVRGAGTAASVVAPRHTENRGSSKSNAVDGLKNGLASGLAAAVVKTILQPFDTMKTVQQFSTARMTLLQAGRDLLARGGVPELYQGLGVTLIGSMPSVGIYFGIYQFVKKQMDSHSGVSPYLSITISAGAGNFIASFFRVPYEVVKQRLQVGAYPTTMVALHSIYTEGGLAGFFGKGGLKTQWARDIPYAMVTLLVYETLQNYAAKRRGPGATKKGSPIENMIIGAIAGGMGSLVTNPMDMVKTRMMTAPELYASPMDAAWKALRAEGPQAFMKGATPRLLHKIPANAFFFVTYEFFRNILGVSR